MDGVTMSATLLIVDDEKEIVSFMKDALEDEGYQVLTSYSGQEALGMLEHQPDLIILDIMMPHIDGFVLCERIREQVSCPIMFLSAKQNEQDRVHGLMVGGDDYLVKPFSMKELKARIYAHLRREQREPASTRRMLRYGWLTLDLEGYEARYRDQVIPFTSKEFEIVQFLALYPGRVFSREQLYERIWGLEAEGDSTTVTEHIKKIRAKFAEHHSGNPYIATVWGVGYKWER